MPLNLRLRILAGACACLVLPVVAVAAPQAKPPAQAKPGAQAKPAAPAKPAAQTNLRRAASGSKEPGLFNMTGSIYFLTEKETRMPGDLGTRKSEGTIYTDRVDVPDAEVHRRIPRHHRPVRLVRHPLHRAASSSRFPVSTSGS